MKEEDGDDQEYDSYRKYERSAGKEDESKVED